MELLSTDRNFNKTFKPETIFTDILELWGQLKSNPLSYVTLDQNGNEDLFWNLNSGVQYRPFIGRRFASPSKIILIKWALLNRYDPDVQILHSSKVISTPDTLTAANGQRIIFKIDSSGSKHDRALTVSNAVLNFNSVIGPTLDLLK